MTGTPDLELSAIPGNRFPTIDPGSTIPAGNFEGRPKRSINSVAHVRVTGFTSCVVVAFVNSQTAFPVSQ